MRGNRLSNDDAERVFTYRMATCALLSDARSCAEAHNARLNTARLRIVSLVVHLETVHMKSTRLFATRLVQFGKEFTAIICIAAACLRNAMWAAPPQQAAPASSDQAAPKLPADQLDSLVAPIALYPDPLLSIVLMASTYPEVIQLQQWLAQRRV